MPDESIADAAQDAACQPAAAMRNRKKNNPIDCGLMPKKEILQNRILFARGEG